MNFKKFLRLVKKCILDRVIGYFEISEDSLKLQLIVREIYEIILIINSKGLSVGKTVKAWLKNMKILVSSKITVD